MNSGELLKELQKELETALAGLREKNDAPILDFYETSVLRGQIVAHKNFISKINGRLTEGNY